MRTSAIVFSVFAGLSALILAFGRDNTVPDPPEVRRPFTLFTVHDTATNRNAFSYDGETVPPVIRVSPGNSIEVRYVNDLPSQSDEACATGPCTNVSNLHFHGLHVFCRKARRITS